MTRFYKTPSRLVAPVNAPQLHLLALGTAAALFASAVLGAGAVVQRSGADRAALLRSLPQVSELPPGYGPGETLAHRGALYAAGGRPSFRQDDGGTYHGSDSLPVWAKSTKGRGTQGALYGVKDGLVVSAGYLIRRADLVGGKSFRHLSLRGLDFPAPQHLTVEFIEGETADANQYLWLWHFLPQEGAASATLPLGALPAITSLPRRFTLYACEQFPNAFCPRMGRHHTDLSKPGNRPPTATGDDGVIFGEAAGKLIFIEYVFRQQDLEAGASWPPIPLNGLPIPPIDNLHLLHYTGADGAPGRYTAHMYFVPEHVYLAWEKEPSKL